MSEPDTTPALTRVGIDPNIRSHGGMARIGYEDADGPLQPGQTVQVHETETGLTGTGTVNATNDTKRLAWIVIDWTQLRTETGATTATVLASGTAAGGTPADSGTDAALVQRVAARLREHGMVHLGDEAPADEYECCAAAVLAELQHELAEAGELREEQERYEDETVGRFNAQTIRLTRRAEKADDEVRRLGLMVDEYAQGARGLSDKLREARATNQRLNHRAQTVESRLAKVTAAVAGWRISSDATYVPLRTLNAIAKAVGVALETERWEHHYQHVEALEAALTEARADLDALRTLTPDARRLAAGILGAEPNKPGSTT